MICHCLADQLFDLLATDKSKPRDEMIQGAYLFVILHVKHKKITIYRNFNMISNSW